MSKKISEELKEKIKKVGEIFEKKNKAFNDAEKARENGDYEKARELYLEAIEFGDMMAANNLGTMYMNGMFDNGERDYESAEKYYSIGADKMQKNCLANLANLYAVRDKDYKKAYELYLKACDGKYAWPVYKIGMFFMYGYLGDVNYIMALHYLSLANEMGYDDSYHLGIMYLYNLGGITNDVDYGIKLLKERCKETIRDRDSALDLGYYYASINDSENAEIYTKLAIEYGYADAKERIDKKITNPEVSLYGGEDNE